MIEIGKQYKLVGATGSATITRKQEGNGFFWAMVSWAGYKYDGQEAPFSKTGEHYGSSAWKIPNLDIGIIEEDL